MPNTPRASEVARLHELFQKNGLDLETKTYPPIVPFYTKLEILVVENPVTIAVVFLGMLFVALIASLPAASRAARMNIAEALSE